MKKVEIKAEEIVLDLPNKVLLNLLNDYNKGKQLWMSKTKNSDNDEKKELVSKKEVEKESIKKVVKPKYYPIVWYKPNESYTTKTATIEYADNPKLKKLETTTIKNSIDESCSQKDRLLIVKTVKANIREGASLEDKIYKTVSKNYVLPYKIKIGSWYKLCDNRYVHKNIVDEISFKEINKKVK